MKFCITHVKTIKKPNKQKSIEVFCDTLVDAGMPDEIVFELMSKHQAIWESEDVDSKSIFAAEIIEDPDTIG